MRDFFLPQSHEATKVHKEFFSVQNIFFAGNPDNYREGSREEKREELFLAL